MSKIKEFSKADGLNTFRTILTTILKDNGRTYGGEDVRHMRERLFDFIYESDFKEFTFNELRNILEGGITESENFGKITVQNVKFLLNTYSRTLANKRLAKTASDIRNRNEKLMGGGVSDYGKAVVQSYTLRQEGLLDDKFVQTYGEPCEALNGRKSIVPKFAEIIKNGGSPRAFVKEMNGGGFENVNIEDLKF